MRRQTDPWAHRETDWTAEFAAQSETLLALSNGYLGIRGTLDEGEPAAIPGTYLAGFYEKRPIPYAERGYGDPESEQVLADVIDGTRIRLTVEDEPLDVRTGTVLEHDRVLDLRDGIVSRTLRWRSPTGDEVTIHSRRLVSLDQREVAAIDYRVEAVDRPLRISISSELVAPGSRKGQSSDPRGGVALPADTLQPRTSRADARRAVLAYEARGSARLVAAGMDHELEAAQRVSETCTACDNLARWSVTATLAPGEPLHVTKLLAYHWVQDARVERVVDDVARNLDQARRLGFEELAARQRAALDAVWAHADIELDGDPEIQHALRYALFQLHQNAACAAGRGIPAKGLTGPGYDGHTFWDTEIFLLPALTACATRHAEDALRWRASTLPQARARARRLGLQGAAFPWRTIGGEECSGYLPAGTAAFHVNADIAHASALHQRGARRALRARGGCATARRDGASVGEPRIPRRPTRRALLHRRRHRARRVLGPGGQQPLHEPHGAGEPPGRRRHRRAHRSRRTRG